MQLTRNSDGARAHLRILQLVVGVHRLAIDLGRLHVVAHIRVHMICKVHHGRALHICTMQR